MIILVLLLAVAGGAYWAGSRGQRFDGRRSRGDQMAARDARLPGTSGKVAPWIWVVAVAVLAVVVLGTVCGPGFFGGPGALVGPGVLGP